MRGKRLTCPPVRRSVRIIPAHAGQTTCGTAPAHHRTDHPRACGANSGMVMGAPIWHGSSPRMRGKPVRCQPCVLPFRIIPAHAGQTWHAFSSRLPCSDHPRACGANVSAVVPVGATIGSSPRMRGKRPAAYIEHHPARIIPAHAGQTELFPSPTLGVPDHPRACGANFSITVLLCVLVGSSPRMRGKHVGGTLPEEYRRIIPAHAGQTEVTIRHVWPKSDHPRACGANVTGEVGGMRHGRIIPAHAGQTLTTDCNYPYNTDHPRACGANPIDGGEMLDASGSSPRMRGKLFRVLIRIDNRRIIPAHAGQTIVPRYPQTTFPDHPRACGANSVIAIDAIVVPGSSPRMRGKLRGVTRGENGERIIPAHAGQTPPNSPLVVFHPDHPRACGANRLISVAAACRDGSSPRMRGKPGTFKEALDGVRIIPAHAGQTNVGDAAAKSPSDHPRACGANCRCCNMFCTVNGSSPRMRGKRLAPPHPI